MDTSMVATSSIMTESTTVMTDATEKEKLDIPVDDAVVQLSLIENEDRDGSQFIMTSWVDTDTSAAPPPLTSNA